MKMEINFFNENVTHVIRKKGELRRWIVDVITNEGGVGGSLNFILCDDRFLSELNFRYLKHKSLTDILTFPLDDDSGGISGDIYMSIQRIKENASLFKQKPEDELHRVMVHGILHLIGYNDSSAKEKQAMREREDYYLALL